MALCDCQRERAIYFCDEPTCKHRELQSYYCDECAEQSEGKHLHAPKKIVKETANYNSEWICLKRAIAEVMNPAAESMAELGPVVRYLERALIGLS
jgi:methionyl-tRNA synthetase